MERRRINRPIAIVMILFIITLCSAIFFYQYLFNSINATDRDEINREISLITEDVIRNLEKDIKPDAEPSEDISPVEPEQGESEKTEPAPVDPEKVEKAVTKVKTACEKGFLKLEDEGNLMVDKLLESAKADYIEIRNAGGATGELLKLASTYSNRAKALEKSMDSAMETVIGKLSSELKKAGMVESDIKTYLTEIRTKYKEQKDSRRKLILDKAKEYL